MTADDLLQKLLDAYEERVNTAPEPRPMTRGNHPWGPEYQRPERRTRPTYSDPTGNAAVGNLSKKRKKP